MVRILRLATNPVLVALWLLVATRLVAADAQDLIYQDTRPTFSEYAESDARAVSPPSATDIEYLDKGIREAPAMIAGIEKVFPGAIIACVGRDSQVWGDIFEAFYLSKGQTDRVVRIGLSSGSFSNTPTEYLVKYMEQLGMNLDPNASDVRPFVLFDTVSASLASNGGKQPRQLLDAAYREFARRGGAMRDLVRRVNFVGLSVSSQAGGDSSLLTGAEQKLQSLESSLSRANARTSVDSLFDFVYIRMPTDEAFKIGYDNRLPSWHGTFDALVMKRDGTVAPQPGAQKSTSTKQRLLTNFRYIAEQVNDSDFSETVENYAKRLGYSITERLKAGKQPEIRPPERTTTPNAAIDPADARLTKLLDELRDRDSTLTRSRSVDLELDKIFVDLGPGADLGGKLTPNGAKILEGIESLSSRFFAGLVAFQAFERIRTARKEKEISAFDLQVLTGKILGSSELTLTLAKSMIEFTSISQGFAYVLSQDSYFKKEAPDAYSELMELLNATKAGKSCVDLALGTAGR